MGRADRRPCSCGIGPRTPDSTYHSPVFAYLPLSGEKVTGALGSKAERAAAASRLHGAIVFGREGNTPVITVWQFRLENVAAADVEPQVVTPILGKAAAAAMRDAPWTTARSRRPPFAVVMAAVLGRCGADHAVEPADPDRVAPRRPGAVGGQPRARAVVCARVSYPLAHSSWVGGGLGGQSLVWECFPSSLNCRCVSVLSCGGVVYRVA